MTLVINVAGFTTPVVKEAAAAVKEKMEKYEQNLKGTLPQIACILDPRIGTMGETARLMKPRIEELLNHFYGYDANGTESSQNDSDDGDIFSDHARRFGVFQGGSSRNEVSEYFEFTKRPDRSCGDVVEWWATIGRSRFPMMSQVARDTRMIMGSSVPSESAFSDSGGALVFLSLSYILNTERCVFPGILIS
jgi:hypothetical protein